MFDYMEIVVPIIIAIIGLMLVIAVIMSMWKKVPQDKAGVVTGMKKRVVTGGGTLIVPVLERMDIITLENITLGINTTGAMTNQGVPITATGVAVIKIRNDQESILSAVEQFYTGREDQTLMRIRETSTSVLEGKLREIVGKLTVEEIYKDREAFSQQVRDVADSSLTPMGFELKAFTIKEITDQNGYLDALGAPRIAAVKRDAEIAKAEAQRDAQIKISEANKIGLAAKLQAESEVAKATKDKEVRESAYKREAETARAEADAAYQIQQNIMLLKVTETAADAEILKQQRAQGVASEEKEVEVAREKKNIELYQTKAEAKKRELDETVVNPAEASRKEAELRAEAEKVRAIKRAEAEAEAKKLDAFATAEAKKLEAAAAAEAKRLTADAEAFQLSAIGEKEAEVTAKKGRAEAEAIKLKLEAEAEGMQKKAEAYKQYGEAAMTQMIIEVLPNIAQSVAAPIGNIDKVMVWDGGGAHSGGKGAVRMAENVTSTMAAVMTAVKEMTGIDIADLVNKATRGKDSGNFGSDNPIE